MGRVKQDWEETLAQGYTPTDKIICAKCITEEYLSKYINDNGGIGVCSYCKRRKKVSPLDEILGKIVDGIYFEYNHPENGAGWDSEEGEWASIQIFTTSEILRDDFDFSDSPAIKDILNSIIDKEWCKKDFYALSKHEEMNTSWNNFKKQLKYETRFVFIEENKTTDPMGYQIYEKPYDVMKTIGSIIEPLELIKTIPQNTIIFRARETKPSENFTQSSELGSPPPEKAKYPNRMSPSGISMFYGAFDKDTCIQEIKNSKFKIYTIAKLNTLKDLLVLDFTIFKKGSYGFYYPDFPSIFDESNRWKIPYYRFFLNFVLDLNSSIKKDGREHIEYVPTQVFSEYFRRIYKTEDDKSLNGIIYHSSKHKGVCCVLFCGPEGCTKTEHKEDQQILKLSPKSIKRITVSR